MPDLSPVDQLLDRAAQIRKAVTQPSVDADPGELVECAGSARRAADALEFIAATVIRRRWEAANELADAEGALEDAEVALELQQADYRSARETDLEIRARTIDVRRQVRLAQRRLNDLRSAEEYVRMMHRGAEAARRDIDTRLRALSLMTMMER